MPLILGANSLTGGYEVDNSLRFNSGSSDNLSRTPASAVSRQICTYSAWIKISEIATERCLISASPDGSNYNAITIGRDSGVLRYYEVVSNSTLADVKTSQLFRDPSAWYHIVVAIDSTQATSSNRIKIYVNGSQVTSFLLNTVFAQNTNTSFGSNCLHTIGRYADVSAGFFNGYHSEVYFINGQQLDPTDFGEFDEDSGIWKPIAYEGTYGTNGFYLEFQDSSALGDDTSGNGNDFTVNNLTSIDQSYDSPTNNFCTLNPLDTVTTNLPTFSNGNLTVSTSSTGASPCRSTFSVDKGKWYWEIKKTSAAAADTVIGIMEQSEAFNTYIGSTAKGYGYISTANKVNNSSQVSYGATYTNGDIIGVALDMDNGTLIFYKNGVSQGTAYSSLSGLFSPAHSDGGTGTETADCNFGYPPFTISSGNADANGFGNFEYAVPSGYYALCTKNLALYG